MASSFEISIKPSIESRGTMRFVDNMTERFRNLKRMIVYVSAQQMFESVQGMLPSRPEYAELRNGLEFAEIGSDPDSPAFSVYVPPKTKQIRPLDERKTLLFVRTKRNRLNRASRRVKFLEDNGPWTTDTIPFWPAKSEAIIVQRKVSAREVAFIARKQHAAAGRIEAELRRLGVKPTNREPPSKRAKRNRKAVSDASMLAIQLEFGGGAHPAIPAWRISVGNLLRTKTSKLALRYPKLAAALKDPGSTTKGGWPRVDKKIKVEVAQQFVVFMKKLGML